jgi:acetoin utilization protein AcuB
MEDFRKLKEDLVTARELMTENPATLTAQATIAEAWDLMRELEIRHVPVIQGGALVGMLSDRDLARVDIGSLLMAEGAAAAGQDLGTPIAGLMSTDVIFVQPETELSDVIDLLIESRVGALPVVDADTRAVVGIVSYIDVLRAMQDQLEEQ